MNTFSESTAALMIAPRATASPSCMPARSSGRDPLYAAAHPVVATVRHVRRAALYIGSVLLLFTSIAVIVFGIPFLFG